MVRIVRGSNGIECSNGKFEITLDPKVARDRISFTSHAHMDHLPSPKSTGTVLCTEETAGLAASRGKVIADSVCSYEDVQMVHSGHILGGCGLLFDDVFYTGDICTRDRPGMRGAAIPKCKTLVTECTFGDPRFTFPPFEEVAEEANAAISEMYSRGVPVILMGYELGKAQTVCKMFSHWKPLVYHERVKKMNDACRKLGMDVPDAASYEEAKESGILERGPWVMVAPMVQRNDAFVQDLRSKYGAVTMGFSGWAAVPENHLSRRCDRMFVYSDHSDYVELVRMVQESGARTVYTVHGFTQEFARDLRRNCGIEAHPLE